MEGLVARNIRRQNRGAGPARSGSFTSDPAFTHLDRLLLQMSTIGETWSLHVTKSLSIQVAPEE